MPISFEKLEQARTYIPNLRFVDENLCRGGQPDAKGIKALKDAGVTTIVSLCGGSNLVSLFRTGAGATCETAEAAAERLAARELGLNYVTIPMDVFGEPGADVIEQFIDVMQNPDMKPAFIHCMHGRDRTGLMLSVYRVMFDGWTAERAYKEALECGFDADRTNLSSALFSFAKRLTGR